MSAYVVFTHVRTRDPPKLAQCAALAPAFVAGHAVERLTNFGVCEVPKGAGVEGVALGCFVTMVLGMSFILAWLISSLHGRAS